jgi:hypothetical protein
MTTDTGGPAFPCHPGIENPIYDGMSLRDYFAAKVIQGICANPDDIHVPEDETYDQYVDEISRSAYKIADAMLKARKA